MTYYDPEERGHRRGTCARCGYKGWSDDCGQCPNCEPQDDARCEYCDGPECSCARCMECNDYLNPQGACDYCPTEATS